MKVKEPKVKPLPICPYCQQPTRKMLAKELFTRTESRGIHQDFTPVYRCHRCNAHAKGDIETGALRGIIADKPLRALQQRVRRLTEALAARPGWSPGKVRRWVREMIQVEENEATYCTFLNEERCYELIILFWLYWGIK